MRLRTAEGSPHLRIEIGHQTAFTRALLFCCYLLAYYLKEMRLSAV